MIRLRKVWALVKERAALAWRIGKSAPLRVKIVMVLVTLYLASPIDLIPDFIPVLGQLDDIVIVGIAGRYIIKHVPEFADVIRKPTNTEKT